MGHRLRRVNESVREVVSAAIADGLKDPRVGFVTVTAVETSQDLRHAKVFVSVLAGAPERAATLEGLRASHGYLQARINDELHLKHTPQLEFVYDETTDRAMRIEALMKREAELLGEKAPEAGQERPPEAGRPGPPEAGQAHSPEAEEPGPPELGGEGASAAAPGGERGGGEETGA